MTINNLDYFDYCIPLECYSYKVSADLISKIPPVFFIQL